MAPLHAAQGWQVSTQAAAAFGLRWGPSLQMAPRPRIASGWPASSTFSLHPSMPLTVSTTAVAGGSGSGGSGSGWRWWREEDPYWPMRDWGDHPMRWWTWGLAGLLAGAVLNR